ncbi:MAG: ankyrin repeat domain-containing protein, partial [Tenericutes bacterium]|nr:ankyrin repeat domain-containing protein [Mycoplasmatota bacterium]
GEDFFLQTAVRFAPESLSGFTGICSEQITNGNNNEIDRILQSGFNPQIKDDSTYLNPFILAAKVGNVELVDRFVNLGFDVNSKGHTSTAIFEAITNLNFELVDYLLKRGANINLGSWIEGETAAMVLITKLHDKNNRTSYDRNTILRMLEKIIENDYDLDSGAWYGNPLYESITKNDYEITELLLKNGADPYYIQSESNMNLIEIAYSENQELGQLLEKYASF